MGRDGPSNSPAHSDDEEQDHGADAVEPDCIDMRVFHCLESSVRLCELSVRAWRAFHVFWENYAERKKAFNVQ